MYQILIRIALFLIVVMSPFAWSTTVATDTQQHKIIGGTDNTESYPWMVSIQRGYHFCGGVLIGKDWVLTAAHCLKNKVADDLTLYIGLEHLSNPSTGEVRNAEWFLIHPDYNENNFYSDIAIIKLDQSSEQTPISILSREATLGLQQNEQLRILGWGVTDDGSTSRQLQEVEVSYQVDPVCDATYPINGVDLYWDRSFCAGEVSGGKDSCQGDSGGPILVRAQNQWALTGLVSWGSGCAEAGLYGVYSEVSAMADWISTRREGVTLFGSGRVGFLGKDRSKTQSFTLQNLSKDPQRISRKHIDNYYFEFDSSNWLLGDELPASHECSFTVNADGLWAGEHNAKMTLDFANNTVESNLNSKVLSRLDAHSLDTQWQFYSGTSQISEHSKPWKNTTDSERGDVLASGDGGTSTRSVLLTYLNGPISEEEPRYLKFKAKVSDSSINTLKLFINEETVKTIQSESWANYSVELEPGINHTMFIYYQYDNGTAFLDDLKICTDRLNDASCSSASGYFNTDDLATLDDPGVNETWQDVCEPLTYEDSIITYVSRTNNDIVHGSSQATIANSTSHMLGGKSSGGGIQAGLLLLLMSLVIQTGVKRDRRFK